MEINQLKQIIEDKTYTPYENLVYVLKALDNPEHYMKNVIGKTKL